MTHSLPKKNVRFAGVGVLRASPEKRMTSHAKMGAKKIHDINRHRANVLAVHAGKSMLFLYPNYPNFYPNQRLAQLCMVVCRRRESLRLRNFREERLVAFSAISIVEGNSIPPASTISIKKKSLDMTGFAAICIKAFLSPFSRFGDCSGTTAHHWHRRRAFVHRTSPCDLLPSFRRAQSRRSMCQELQIYQHDRAGY